MEKRILEYIWQRQADFNNHFMKLGPQITMKEREELTAEYALYLVDEVMSLLKELGWKLHRRENANVIWSNVNEELIDIFKYWNALALIWEMTPEVFLREWERKTEVVEQRYDQEFANPWDPAKYKACAAVDIDGVLADYMPGLISFIQERTGVGVPMPDRPDFYGHVGKYIGHEKAYELKHIFRETGIESSGLEAVAGSVEFLNRLRAQNYYILLITARPYKRYKRMMSDTIGWLKHFGFPYDSILFDENKEDRIIKEFSFAEFVIEDTLSNAVRIASKGIKVYLRDLSYNQGETHGLPIERFKEFNELLK